MSIRPLNLIGTILIVAIGSSLFAPPRLLWTSEPKAAHYQIPATERKLCLPQCPSSQ